MSGGIGTARGVALSVGAVSAVAVLFTAICGWEATASLSAEYTHPTHVRRAARASLTVVAVLYAGLAVCTVGVLGDDAADTPVPLMRLITPTDQPWAATAVAAAAMLFTVAASITFVAAGARAGLALARHRVLPATLAVTGHDAEPRRSALAQAGAAATVAVIAVAAPHAVTVETLIRVFAALLACVTLVGLIAAARLLPQPRQRASAVVAALAVAIVAALSTTYLPAPAAIAAAVLTRRRSSPSVTEPQVAAAHNARSDNRDTLDQNPLATLGRIR
ncbi:amino acid permease [Micromonospora fulviviridis]|uniref:amino acid permease n=1 Tax=Micromonospora fulviviridis TaxID=47860 RepID=UPI00379567D8